MSTTVNELAQQLSFHNVETIKPTLDGAKYKTVTMDTDNLTFISGVSCMYQKNRISVKLAIFIYSK